MLINIQMPTIVGVLTFISMINTISERLKARKFFIFQHFSSYEQLKFCAQLSMKKVLLPRGQITLYGFFLPNTVMTLNPGHADFFFNVLHSSPISAHLSHWFMVSIVIVGYPSSVVQRASCVVRHQQLLQRTSPPKLLAGF